MFGCVNNNQKTAPAGPIRISPETSVVFSDFYEDIRVEYDTCVLPEKATAQTKTLSSYCQDTQPDKAIVLAGNTFKTSETAESHTSSRVSNICYALSEPLLTLIA